MGFALLWDCRKISPVGSGVTSSNGTMGCYQAYWTIGILVTPKASIACSGLHDHDNLNSFVGTRSVKNRGSRGGRMKVRVDKIRSEPTTCAHT